MHTVVSNWHDTPAHSALSVSQFLANKMTLGPPPGVALCFFSKNSGWHQKEADSLSPQLQAKLQDTFSKW